MIQLVHMKHLKDGDFGHSHMKDEFIEDFILNSGAPGIILGVLIGLIALAVIVFYLATSANLGQELGKRKGFTAGWLWGLLMGPVGILLILVRPSKKTDDTGGVQ